MQNTSEVVLVLTTFPDQATATNMATDLLANKLAACVNVISGITSHYHWAGKLETSQEFQLIIKTAKDLIPDLERQITKNHPYECPEILVLPISQGSTQYLEWMMSSLKPECQ